MQDVFKQCSLERGLPSTPSLDEVVEDVVQRVKSLLTQWEEILVACQTKNLESYVYYPIIKTWLNKSVQLDLQHTGLQDESAKSVVQIVQQHLSNIEEIDLSYNSLHQIPVGIEQLKQLISLKVTYNESISELPAWVTQSRLKLLCVKGTSINKLPDDIWQASPSMVISCNNALFASGSAGIELASKIEVEGYYGPNFVFDRLAHARRATRQPRLLLL